MATITDSLGNWEQLGEITVNNQWQLFEIATSSETFRITTTILSQDDWDNKKIRSAAYIRFHYSDGSVSERIYIPVRSNSIIKDFLIPISLKNQNLLREIDCIFSHPKINKYSLTSFAAWTLKLEALL